ncbi:hypothetical protein GCM10020216_060750 [Nonomuraea helvata]
MNLSCENYASTRNRALALDDVLFLYDVRDHYLLLKGNLEVKGYMQVLITVPSVDESADLARSITSQRLVAGVHIAGLIRSPYCGEALCVTSRNGSWLSRPRMLYTPHMRSTLS